MLLAFFLWKLFGTKAKNPRFFEWSKIWEVGTVGLSRTPGVQDKFAIAGNLQQQFEPNRNYRIEQSFWLTTFVKKSKQTRQSGSLAARYHMLSQIFPKPFFTSSFSLFSASSSPKMEPEFPIHAGLFFDSQTKTLSRLSVPRKVHFYFPWMKQEQKGVFVGPLLNGKRIRKERCFLFSKWVLKHLYQAFFLVQLANVINSSDIDFVVSECSDVEIGSRFMFGLLILAPK